MLSYFKSADLGSTTSLGVCLNRSHTSVDRGRGVLFAVYPFSHWKQPSLLSERHQFDWVSSIRRDLQRIEVLYEFHVVNAGKAVWIETQTIFF